MQLRSSVRPRAQRKSIPFAEIAVSARRMSMSAQAARQPRTQAAGSALFAIGNLFWCRRSLARAQARASPKIECACFWFLCVLVCAWCTTQAASVDAVLLHESLQPYESSGARQRLPPVFTLSMPPRPIRRHVHTNIGLLMRHLQQLHSRLRPLDIDVGQHYCIAGQVPLAMQPFF